MANSCIYVDWDGAWDVFTEKLVRARKVHSCGECGDDIEVGDLHEVAGGLFDGSWVYNRTCARCLQVRDDYFDSWIYGEMATYFMEAHGFDYRDGIPADFAPCRSTTEGSEA